MAASLASTNRDEALDKVYEEIEKDLIVSFNLCNFFLDILTRIGNFIVLSQFWSHAWKIILTSAFEIGTVELGH